MHAHSAAKQRVPSPPHSHLQPTPLRKTNHVRIRRRKKKKKKEEEKEEEEKKEKEETISIT